MGVIFDLDQTLVDSSSTEQLRKQKRWPAVYSGIKNYSAYDGVLELLKHLEKNKIPVCVVTSGQATYCGKVLGHFKMDLSNRICYHDTTYKKPHPEPIAAGIAKLKLKPGEVISVGDDPKDIIASKAAGAFAVAALWGTVDRDALLAQNPDAACETVAELRTLINKRLGLKD